MGQSRNSGQGLVAFLFTNLTLEVDNHHKLDCFPQTILMHLTSIQAQHMFLYYVVFFGLVNFQATQHGAGQAHWSLHLPGEIDNTLMICSPLTITEAMT